ncbi:hypothetical protein [Crocosphaera chwakensis]|uniref:Uncharacterized protein n=1 Tax=Crocosphaera chwakensis CCY0110 TaxID=391612 RepID=A3IS40_9CHRO|nr:hypothetical protein [Crocosphaera chwakensis]EAZ90718.1 hypothetical protein CY0110_32260 [Crocosphaera chwakensis CCY0110]
MFDNLSEKQCDLIISGIVSIAILTLITVSTIKANEREKRLKNESYMIDLPEKTLLINGLQKEEIDQLNSDALLGLGPTGIIISCGSQEFRFGRATDYYLQKVPSNYQIPNNVIDCR